MRALVCHAPLDLRLDTFAAETLGPQQLRVRVAFDQANDAFKLAGDKRQSMKVQIAFTSELAW